MRVEVISYLGLLVQFSPAAGRAGLCRQLSLCVGSTRRVLARQPEVLAASPRVRHAFSLRGEQPRRPEVLSASPRVLHSFSLRVERLRKPEVLAASPWVWRAFSSVASRPGSQGLVRTLPRARHAFSLCVERPRRPEVCAASPRARCAFSLRGPSARRRLGLRKSLDRKRGLFAVWEGVASLGLSLPLSPPRCLLPPAGTGQLFFGVSQSLCFANRRRCVPAG